MMPTDQDMLSSMYQPPEVGAGVASGATPEMLAQAYEGGGLQKPLLDPIDIFSGFAANKLVRSAGMGVAKEVADRATEYIDPADPLGSVNHVLQRFGFNKVPMRTVAEHKALEEAALTSPKAAQQLTEFEMNMHRLSNYGKATAVFEEVDTALPDKAPYYRQQLAKITQKLSDSGALGGGGMTGERTATPMPTSIVKDMKRLLESYKKDLVRAGKTEPLDIQLYPVGSGE
jgi:hypothetical protein